MIAVFRGSLSIASSKMSPGTVRSSPVLSTAVPYTAPIVEFFTLWRAQATLLWSRHLRAPKRGSSCIYGSFRAGFKYSSLNLALSIF